MSVRKTQKIWGMILFPLTFLFLLVHAVSAGEGFKNIPLDGGGSYFSVGPPVLEKMLEKKDFLFINVLIPYEGEIKDTDLFIPYNEIQKNLNKLPPEKNAKIVLYCRTDRMSIIAAHTLVTLGYSNVWSLEGGMTAWKKAGLPVLDTRNTP